MDFLHEEYEADGRTVLFRCRECGYTSLCLGALHGHAERHRGFTRFNIQLPFTSTSPADVDALMELTEVLRVDETTPIVLEDVEGL